MSLTAERAQEARGAYGLRLRGLPGADDLLAPASPGWPELTVEQTVVDRLPETPAGLDNTSGRFSLPGRASSLELSRDPLLLRALMLSPWPDSTIVHPFLATAAAVANRWLERETFHAGAFAGDGGAWAVLGAKQAGKSTMLAGLALRGAPVLSDDLLVLHDGVAFAGPRCIDLRPDAGARLGGEDLGVVGNRPRRRLQLPRTAAHLPLQGWLLPAWGPRLRVTKVHAAQRLPALVRNLAMTGTLRSPARLLDLAALPMYQVTRPRAWSSADHVTDALLNL